MKLIIVKEGKVLYPKDVREADCLLQGLYRFMVPATLIFDGEVVGEVCCSVEQGWNVWRDGYFMK